jgi:hypothetical protein
MAADPEISQVARFDSHLADSNGSFEDHQPIFEVRVKGQKADPHPKIEVDADVVGIVAGRRRDIAEGAHEDGGHAVLQLAARQDTVMLEGR